MDNILFTFLIIAIAIIVFAPIIIIFITFHIKDDETKFFVTSNSIIITFIIFSIVGLIVNLCIIHQDGNEALCNNHNKETVCECCECKEKITESQYQEAKDLVDKYEKQK